MLASSENPLTAPSILSAGPVITHGWQKIPEGTLLFVQAGSEGGRVQLEAARVEQSIDLLPGQAMILLASEGRLRDADSSAVRFVAADRLCKLLAFLDAVDPLKAQPLAPPPLLSFEVAPECLVRQRALEYWFIRQVMQGKEAIEPFKNYLRRQESYWLVKFLLAESAQKTNISLLGHEYGLSYSHFRRVCKTVLGNSVKSEMRSWRAARTLLDAIASRSSMTQVAIENGYASSSHFSSEIKKMFGISPRVMTGLKPCD